MRALAATVFAAAVAALAAAPALAWQIEDPIHANCHERITEAALAAAGYVAPPPALEGDDALLPESVQFDLGRYDPNPYAFALVLGVRYPDLLGGPDFDFDDLAGVHNAAGGQGEHCLRAEDQDGPEGDIEALAACTGTIRALYWQALQTLDAAGEADADVTTPAPVWTPVHGRIDYPLSAYYWYAGRALHAIQDSFTHTFRANGLDPGGDWKTVRHVFNWSDQVACTLDEARDGHGHETFLDDCEADPPGHQGRFEASIEASRAFLALLGEPGDAAARAARLEGFLAEWFSYEPGCTFENGYCENATHAALLDHPESDAGICEGCGASPAPFAWLAAVLLLVALAARRRAALLIAVALAASPAARAADYRTEVRGSLSVQNPAYALGAAAKLTWPRFEAGVFAELNPWYSVERGRLAGGSLNAGLQALYLHPLSRSASLRAGVLLGTSTLLDDQIGSEAGTTGWFAGLRLLGVVLRLDERVSLTVDGFDLALPAPQTVGWPILYAQHRLSIGLAF